MQLNHSSIDQSLAFVQSYVNGECNLQDAVGVGNRNLQVIYWSGYHTITHRRPTLTNYIMSLIQDSDGWISELVRPNKTYKYVFTRFDLLRLFHVFVKCYKIEAFTS